MRVKAEPIQYLWKDTKRWLGMPLTTTKYRLSEDRLFMQKGIFRTTYEETVLYRIQDISISRTLGQRLFGVGTVRVHSSDATNPHLDLVNIRHPMEVKELIYHRVEAEKSKRDYRITEYVTDEHGGKPEGPHHGPRPEMK